MKTTLNIIKADIGKYRGYILYFVHNGLPGGVPIEEREFGGNRKEVL